MKIEINAHDLSRLLIACTTLYSANPENRSEYKRIHDELARQRDEQKEG